MRVSELIDLSKRTVFKQMSISTSDILANINLALLELYKDFSVNDKEQTLVLDSSIHVYSLNPDVMTITAVYTSEKYLKDGDGQPLNNTSNKVVEISLNNDKDPNSLLTPTANTCMVTYPTTGQIISIIYRAGSVSIEEDELDEVLPISQQYVEPLLMYLGYLGRMSINPASNDTAAFLQKYRSSVASINHLGIINKEHNTNTKLYDKGFI